MKSLQLFVLSSKKEHRVYLESLLSKHTTYLLKIYEQIIQYGRFKKKSVALERVLKNVTEWSDNDPNFILTIYKLINQGVKIFSEQYYNTHQIPILSNTVMANIYDNCNYTLCVNWEIEKTSETPSKKEFYIDNLETGLKKTDFNIIASNDEINDMNDNNRDYPNNDLFDDVYNLSDHDSVDMKQTNHNNLYTLADNKLQLSYDLEDLDWSSTNSHEGELIIAYDNKVRYKRLYPRAFYTLYIKPNEEGSRHLIYRLSTDQIVVSKEYQTAPLPEDMDNTLFESHPCKSKSQAKNVDTTISSIHNDQCNNYNNNDQTSIIDEDQCLQGTNTFLQSSLLTSL